MSAAPARDALAGGMVNMTPGTGTAPGLAVASPGLHAGALLRRPGAGLKLPIAALAAVALIVVRAGLEGAPAVRGARGGLQPGGPR